MGGSEGVPQGDEVFGRLSWALEGAPHPLLRRLEAPDGRAWARAALGAIRAPVPGDCEHAGATAAGLERKAGEAVGEESRALFRCVLAAVQGRRLESVTRDAWIEIASALPEAWGDVFAAVLSEDGAANVEDEGPSSSPERIGDYELLEPLGRGSFGAVYRAVQPELGREVAIKLLRPEVFSQEGLSKFLDEGRVSSSLSHPGIAILHQAGFHRRFQLTTPYLVMELVRGEPITRWARNRGVDVEMRLRLIIQACDALQHAHEHGVIHRDLHPGNLLVRDDATLKVVDFGSAFSRERDHQAAGRNEVQGTLAYMSPEQARSAAVDARTDVFGLGAILFELLAGEPPTVLERLSPPGQVAAVAEGRARRLRALDPRFDRDLDAICARALADEPEARYASARELGEDLRRYLRGLPVEARPPNFFVSVGKLARRHRREVAGIALALLATGVTGIVAIAGWNRASQRRIALEASQLHGASLFRELIARLLTASEKYEAKWTPDLEPAEYPRYLRAFLPDSPELRADCLELVARDALARSAYDEARDARERALRLRLDALMQHPGVEEHEVAYTKALVRLADVNWTWLRRTLGDDFSSQEARQVVQQTRGQYQQALAQDEERVEASATAPHLDDLFWSHRRLQSFFLVLGERAESDEHLAAMEWISSQLLALDPDRPHSHFARAEAMSARADRLEGEPGKEPETLEAAREAVDHGNFAFLAEPDREAFHRTFFSALARLTRLEKRYEALDPEALGDLRSGFTWTAPPGNAIGRMRDPLVAMEILGADFLTQLGRSSPHAVAYLWRLRVAMLEQLWKRAQDDPPEWISDLYLMEPLISAASAAYVAGDLQHAGDLFAEVARRCRRVRELDLDPTLFQSVHLGSISNGQRSLQERYEALMSLDPRALETFDATERRSFEYWLPRLAEGLR